MTPEAELSLMRSIILMVGFRGDAFNGACAALLLIGLRGGDFTAASLPREITNGDIHISGLATKALIKMGLIEKVGYMPSPNKDAKGRIVNKLRIPSHKVSVARTWLSRHGFPCTEEAQLSFQGVA